MKRNEYMQKRNKKSSGGMGAWSIVGGAALVLVAALVVVSLPDLKRYIKISTM